MKIIYEPLVYVLPTEKEIINILNSYENSFIASTSQFSNILTKIKSKNKGIVLGCNNHIIDNYKGKTIVFLGDGKFHPLMIKKNFKDKKVITFNPFNLKKKEITLKDIKKFILREAMYMFKIKDAKRIGIIVSTKLGQSNLSKAIKLKKYLEKNKKLVYIFLSETIDANEYLNFKGIDLLINTACPRIALDDYSKFSVPVINFTQIMQELKL